MDMALICSYEEIEYEGRLASMKTHLRAYKVAPEGGTQGPVVWPIRLVREVVC